MHWYLKVLKNYAEFSGRATRQEYWMFVLFNMIFAVVAIILDNVFGTAIENVGYGLFYILYLLAVLLPALGVVVRRLHDVGKSGWMIFISLIPVIGFIWLLVLLVTDSEPGENQYGPNPKEAGSASSAVQGTQPSTATSNSVGDILIIIVVAWMLVSRIFYAAVAQLVPEYYLTSWFSFISGTMGFVWAFVPLTLAFAVKDKSKQTILFVISGLYLLYGIYETIMRIVQ